ncbi:unnamed protein product, partial [Mesorhabditis belari]|uniref:Uncharacterized protein n=1 Tax=Mesorhabditis belari TaxID=2138241 RepID=A0AAF3F2B4_9BILA
MPATGDYHYLSWPIQQPAVNVPFFDIHAYKHVNLDVPPSKNPQGQDLPLNDVSTLRFFFNLSVQQSRVVLLKQHLNQHLSSTSQGSNSDQLESLAQLSPQHHILRQQQNIFAQAQAQAAHQLQLNAARQQPVPQIDPVTSHSLVQQLEQLRVQSSNLDRVMQDLALEREKCQRLSEENGQLKQELAALRKEKLELENEYDMEMLNLKMPDDCLPGLVAQIMNLRCRFYKAHLVSDRFPTLS